MTLLSLKSHHPLPSKDGHSHSLQSAPNALNSFIKIGDNGVIESLAETMMESPNPIDHLGSRFPPQRRFVPTEEEKKARQREQAKEEADHQLAQNLHRAHQKQQEILLNSNEKELLPTKKPPKHFTPRRRWYSVRQSFLIPLIHRSIKNRPPQAEEQLRQQQYHATLDEQVREHQHANVSTFTPEADVFHLEEIRRGNPKTPDGSNRYASSRRHQPTATRSLSTLQRNSPLNATHIEPQHFAAHLEPQHFATHLEPQLYHTHLDGQVKEKTTQRLREKEAQLVAERMV